MTCANIDGVSTAMRSSCPDVISLPKGILDHLSGSGPWGLDDPVLALPFGFVERIVGCPEQRLGVSGVREGRHAEAGGDRHLDAAAGRDPAGRDRRPCALGEADTALGVRPAEDEPELSTPPA